MRSSPRSTLRTSHPLVFRLMIALVALVLLPACQSDSAQPGGSSEASSSASDIDTDATPPDSIRLAVTNAVASIDGLRSGLATTFDTSNVTQETFQRVCKPVKIQAMETARENGWVFQQLGRKHRNPANGLDSLASLAHDQFTQNEDMDSMWGRTTMNGTHGWRYFQRITVEPGCLACHGLKESRPEFVKDGYPNDSAYDFEVGDLRGVYAVFVPMPVHSSDAQTSPGS